MPETQEQPQNRRRRITGTVVSDKMDKTVVVRVDRVFPHPKFKKVVRRSKKYYCHDESNVCGLGDLIEMREVRPLSRRKRWCLVRVVKPAAGAKTPQAEPAAS